PFSAQRTDTIVAHVDNVTAPDMDAVGGACGSNGVSGPITPGLMAWRGRGRDDRDTRRRGGQEEGKAGADRGTAGGGGTGAPGPGAGPVADWAGWAAEAADQDGAGDGAEPGDDRAPGA